MNRMGLIVRSRACVRQQFALIKIAAVVAVASVAVVSVGARAAADVKKEITVAATHATLASKATTLDMVQTHLHHVLNCLVGPKGTAFDSKATNPCASLGNGAIVDSTDAAQKKALQAEVVKANDGLKASELQAAQEIATQINASLTALTK